MASAEREPIIGGLRAEPPARSKGRALGQGSAVKPLEAGRFSALGHDGNAEIAGLDIAGLDIDGRLSRGGHCRTGQ